jgi:hypothetical protein
MVNKGCDEIVGGGIVLALPGEEAEQSPEQSPRARRREPAVLRNRMSVSRRS